MLSKQGTHYHLLSPAVTGSTENNSQPEIRLHSQATIFSIPNIINKSSSSAFRPVLSNLWLLLVLYMNTQGGIFSYKQFIVYLVLLKQHTLFYHTLFMKIYTRSGSKLLGINEKLRL